MSRGKKDRKERVRLMYEAGMEPDDIARQIGISEYTVKVYLGELGLLYKETEKLSQYEKLQAAITRRQLEEYRRRLRPGDTVTVIEREEEGHTVNRRPMSARIIGIYPNIVQTDRGCYQVKEIYLWSGRK